MAITKAQLLSEMNNEYLIAHTPPENGFVIEELMAITGATKGEISAFLQEQIKLGKLEKVEIDRILYYYRNG